MQPSLQDWTCQGAAFAASCRREPRAIGPPDSEQSGHRTHLISVLTLWPPILLPAHRVIFMPVLTSESMLCQAAHSHLAAEPCAPATMALESQPREAGRCRDTSFLFRILACQMSSVARQHRQPLQYSQVDPCALETYAECARNSDFKHRLLVWPVCRTAQAAGAALFTSDPWPTNRNKVNISWAGVAEGGPENKSDPTSTEGDEWPPLSSRGPLALLFTALVLKRGGWIECLSTVYQQKGKDQVTSPE